MASQDLYPLTLENLVTPETKLYTLIDQLRTQEMQRAEIEGRKYKVHGLCAVLGYDPQKHASYFETEVGKDIFASKEVYLHDHDALQYLREAMEVDGAILITPEGKFLHSGRYMEADRFYRRDEKVLATYQNLRDSSDAGTRHLAAIALSAQRHDLLFYTLKSDHPQMRVFKHGSIYRSSVPGEAVLPSY